MHPQLMLSARYITQFIRTFDMSWIYQSPTNAVFSKKEFIDQVQKLLNTEIMLDKDITLCKKIYL